MRDKREETRAYQKEITLTDFLESYNQNMPANFPRVTEALLIKFKEEHPNAFKNKDMWSLDLHRKRLIDWLPRQVS